MTLAVFRAMLLGLLRDPGALLMGFLVPIAFFVIFAEIFANAAAGEFELRVAVHDEVADEYSQRLLVAVRRDPVIHGWVSAGSREDVVRTVRRGDADVGLVIRADGEPLGSLGGFSPPPLLVYADPSSAAAGSLLTGRLQQAYASALPELLLGTVVELIDTEFTTLGDTERAEIDAALRDMGRDAARGAPPVWSLAELIEEQPITGRPAAVNHVAYYAGAIAFMFLLLSASQGAISLLDERDNGVLDRAVAGPGGITVVLNGKFLFLTLQGLVQSAVIFAVAWAVYGVDVGTVPGRWLVVAVLASAVAAAVGLLLVTLCATRSQAQTLTSAVILVVSAIGGSMVPRFFMPSWLQQLGWLTPNTWVLEAWSGVLWREESLPDLALPLSMLLLAAIAALAAAHFCARRLIRS